MRRREFIAVLGGAIAAWPVIGKAQRTDQMRRIGVLMGIEKADPDAEPRAAAFERRLQELGWTDGLNLKIDYRWLTKDADRLRIDARELVTSAPELIVADTTAALTALRPISANIPVVFLRVSDPVGAGFINSLARPGGNITGITNFEYSMGAKWLELLKQIAPRTTRVVALRYPGMAAHDGLWGTIEAAAPTLGVQARAVPARTTAEIENGVEMAAGEPNGGLILLPYALIEINRARIIELAAQHRLPVIYPLRHYASAGGLIAYGLDALDLYRSVAPYVDHVLKGAKPADLPVAQPTKFELAINLSTAKTLGLEVPSILLARADEIIE